MISERTFVARGGPSLACVGRVFAPYNPYRPAAEELVCGRALLKMEEPASPHPLLPDTEPMETRRWVTRVKIEESDDKPLSDQG